MTLSPASSVGASATWTDYTPTLSAAVTPPTLGTGAVQAGRYCAVGAFVYVVARIVFGTAGVDPGSGEYRFSIPVAFGADADANTTLGSALLYDSNTNVGRVAIVRDAGALGAYVTLWVDSATGGVTQASPWTWAASDQLNLAFAYESA